MVELLTSRRRPRLGGGGTDLYRKADGFLLHSDVDEAQEDVLELDEEGVRVHSPVLPRTETRHHALLPQCKKTL